MKELNPETMLYLTCQCEICGSVCTLTTPDKWRGNDTVPCGVCGYKLSKATGIAVLLTDDLKTDSISLDI